MSHTRFELGFSRHKKVSRLSDSAFRLWVSAMDRAREAFASDGLIDNDDLDVVPKCPARGPKRTVLVDEIVGSGLWEVRANAWQIHDYLDWQDSAEEIVERRANARKRMKKVRANAKRTDTTTANEVRSGTSDSYSYSDRSDSGSPEGVQGEPEPDDPGRELPCPPDLAERLEKAGTPAQLAEKLAAPVESIRHEIQQFVSYWVIGKGMGQRRTGWPGKARQWVVDQHAKPGGLKAPGAVQHAQRQADGEFQPSASTAAFFGEGLLQRLR